MRIQCERSNPDWKPSVNTVLDILFMLSSRKYRLIKSVISKIRPQSINGKC